MDLLDRFLAHDAWTTRQLLLRCRALTEAQLDRTFDIGPGSVRATLEHIVSCMERHTSFLHGQFEPGGQEEADSIDGLLNRLTAVAKAFADAATTVRREGTEDLFITNPATGKARSAGGEICHVITHSMHHRAQVLYLLDLLGVEEVLEGDVLGWEAAARGWGWEDGGSYGRPSAEQASLLHLTQSQEPT